MGLNETRKPAQLWAGGTVPNLDPFERFQRLAAPFPSESPFSTANSILSTLNIFYRPSAFSESGRTRPPRPYLKVRSVHAAGGIVHRLQGVIEREGVGFLNGREVLEGRRPLRRSRLRA